ncbi:MAG: helicase SNF2 [Moraxellaceae bacterium]|nr:MAG: helicase SNF2 [Moraxellaceae bacterium]
MTTSDQCTALLQTYNALEESDRKILQVLSVIYQPLQPTELATILRSLGWRSESGQPLANRLNDELKRQWLANGLIMDRGARIQCSLIIAEVLTREIEAAGLLQDVIEAADQVVPVRRFQYLSHSINEATKARYLRNALYRNDGNAVLEEMASCDHFQFQGADLSASLQTICNTPFDLQWFSERQWVIQYLVLAPSLTGGPDSLSSNMVSYFDVIEHLYRSGKLQHPKMFALLGAQRLLKGDRADAKELMERVESSARLSLISWLSFLDGDVDRSIATYKLGLKELRKESGKTAVHFYDLSSIFYVLSLIKSGLPADKVEAKRCLMHLQKNSHRPDHSLIINLLIELMAVLDGKKKISVAYSLTLNTNAPAPLWILFQVLGCYWLGEDVPAEKIDLLERCCCHAFDMKWMWYAYESAALLEQLGHVKKCQESLDALNASGFVPQLMGVVIPTSSWQIALGALQDIGSTSNDKSTAIAESESERLVWIIEEDPYSDEFELKPRQQKRKKNGQWTKGRAVALSRLYRDAKDVGILTDADKAICDTIQEEDYGYYGNTSYYLHSEKSFVAAVGHPNVFWSNQPDSPVEIQRVEPELMVLQKKNKITIQLTPIPGIDEDWGETSHFCLIRKSASNRLQVTEFTRRHLHIFNILGPQGLVVPVNAKTQVLDSISAVAPLLTVHSDIGGGSHSNIDVVEANTRLQIQLQAIGEGLKIECYVQPFVNGGPLFRPGVGGASVFAEIEGKHLQANRDIKKEKSNKLALWNQCPALAGDENDEWLLDDPEQALEVLLQLQELKELPELQDNVELLWPKGKKVKLSREITKEQFQMQVGKKRDWFELKGELTLDNGEIIAMGNLMALMQQSSSRFIHLENGEIVALTQDLKRRLDGIRRFSDDGVFHPMASHAIDELTEGMDVRKNALWKKQLARIDQAQALQPVIPSTLQAELRDYQIEGFNWLARLANWGAGACLADDMGLGKTVQTLAIMLTRAPDGPALVLAPTSVCMNWMEEIQRFSPTLNPVYFGALTGKESRKKCLVDAGPYDVVVCTYGLLQSEAETMATIQWHTIVADEAQAIKNPLTKRSKAVMALQGDFKMVTTGTPIENHLGELWNLFRFINPGLLGSLENFRQRFSNPIENDNDSECKQHLKKLIRPFILRRLKSDVLKELPSRTEITLRVQPSPEEAVMYETLRRQALERIAKSEGGKGQQHIKVLAEITKLRLACCNPALVLPNTDIVSEKLKAFSAVLDELLENRHKALVFSQFVGHLSLIRKLLDDRGIHYQYLDGSTPTKKRKQAVNDFQAGKGDVFLISLKAGGAGLNLTAADYVLHMDPWWNPAVEDQASDRAHRMGQLRPVTIYRFVMKDTIEDKIVNLHQHKRDLANSLLEGSEMSGKMSINDMLSLVGDPSS